VYEARVATNAERAVDLLYVLTEQLPPAVDVSLEDVRGRRRGAGSTSRSRPARGRGAAQGHARRVRRVELAVYSTDDQLTLTPTSSCTCTRAPIAGYTCCREGAGETQTPEPETFALTADQLGPRPDLADALEAAAERLGLERVGGAREPR
jgi:hypothetical protein